MKRLILIFTGMVILGAGALGQIHHIAPEGKLTEAAVDLGHPSGTNRPLDWTVVDSIYIDVGSPTGLAYDGEYFRVPCYGAGAYDPNIFKIDITTGAIVDFFPAPSLWPGGITWDGNYLWVMDYLGGPQIFQISGVNGAIVQSFPVEYTFWCAGVAWDGEYIYYGVITEISLPCVCRIHKIDPESGISVETITVPTGNISGLTYYNGYLWYSDAYVDSLYKMTPTGVIVDSSPAPGPYPSGMTVADGYLWNVDNVTHYIYKFEIALPELSVSLNPYNPPIQIPANGGSFIYDITIENTGTNPAVFDDWSEAILPNGNPYPVLLRTGLSLPAGGSIFRELTQLVPASAPSGAYTYIIYVGGLSQQYSG